MFACNDNTCQGVALHYNFYTLLTFQFYKLLPTLNYATVDECDLMEYCIKSRFENLLKKLFLYRQLIVIYWTVANYSSLKIWNYSLRDNY